MDNTKLMDVKQAAEFLNVPVSKVRSMTRLNLIPHYKIGHYCRYEQEKLVKWLSQLEKGNGSSYE